MLVLIDESGCPGFKLGRGSTPFFVIALVRFDDFAQAEAASAAIGRARSRLGVKVEFKFSKCRDAARDGFFEAVAPCRYRVRAVVVEKATIYNPHLRADSECFYNFFVRNMLHHDGGTLSGARVKIDGSGDRKFRLTLEAYLRRRLGSGRIANVRFADSRSDNLVQLADMCAGAIARSYRQDTRTDHDRWRQRLGVKLEHVWTFQ